MNRPKITTKKIVKQLRLPKAKSHKRDNGRLLIIAGGHKYFGALLYCVKAASRLVDLIYVLTTRDNQKLIKQLKTKTASFIPLTAFPKTAIVAHIDAILIGPGMGISSTTKNLTAQVLKSDKKAVLDADALNVLDGKLKPLLNPKHILTPHHGEFKRLFGIKGSQNAAGRMSKKYRCWIALKGPTDIIAGPQGQVFLNKTGNAGMTKGGTGDVLAGLIAALFCSNDAYTSAAAGTYINGLAGDALYKKVGMFYSAEDLAETIPKILFKFTKT